jgi:hypothetical protein
MMNFGHACDKNQRQTKPLPWQPYKAYSLLSFVIGPKNLKMHQFNLTSFDA